MTDHKPLTKDRGCKEFYDVEGNCAKMFQLYHRQEDVRSAVMGLEGDIKTHWDKIDEEVFVDNRHVLFLIEKWFPVFFKKEESTDGVAER